MEVSVFSDNPSYEGSIDRLLKATSFVRLGRSIQPFSVLFENIASGTNKGPYVNSSPLSSSTNGLPNDPDWVEMDPYPNFDIQTESSAPDQVVIQLNAGGKHNSRGFDISWVMSLSKRLEESGIPTCIVGTGDGYSAEELSTLDRTASITNVVANTNFEEWLAILADARVVISMEGFAAFFALANGRRTAIFNQYPYFDTRLALHDSWIEHTYLQHLFHPNKYVRKIQRLMRRFSRKNEGPSAVKRYSPNNTDALMRFISQSDSLK
ncbi:hypothetical protein JYU04_04260 [Dehalococcoides mccartyi]|nr:hypothetical protein [Dehalococcoides mccartyi]